MDNKLVTIVIPLYTFNLTANEIKSLEQCFSILGKHDTCFILPEKLKGKEPKYIFENGRRAEYFENHYFENVAAYNKLMLSEVFYQRFVNSTYILIYQTDCYIFRDEIKEWCNKGYDYIGAPWLGKKKYSKFYFKPYGLFCIMLKRMQKSHSLYYLVNKVGNGGFSLRRTEKFLEIVENCQEDIIRYKGNGESKYFNEDVFWSIETKRLGYPLKKPHHLEALKFSFDIRPDIAYEENHQTLPMGCHGWNKERLIDFWSKFIETK